jgi:hypothetical protein
MTSAAAARYGRAMPFSLIDFLQALAAGVLVGATYALMCVGLGIIFGAMRVINFAQGDFLMLGRARRQSPTDSRSSTQWRD